MLAFQNKCIRNNEELQKRIRDPDDSKNDIEIFDGSETKEIFEVVNVDAVDTKEVWDLKDVDKTGAKEILEELDFDESATKGMFEDVDIDDSCDSDRKEILEVMDLRKSENKKNSEEVEVDNKLDANETLNMTVDDQDFSIESDAGSTNNENHTHHTQNHLMPDKRRDRYPKSRLEGTLACHICGKRYHNYKLQFHINMHEGECRTIFVPFLVLPILNDNFISFFLKDGDRSNAISITAHHRSLLHMS